MQKNSCCDNPELMDSGESGESGDSMTICFSCKAVFVTGTLATEAPVESSVCCDNQQIAPDSKEGQYVCISCGKIQHDGYLDYYHFDEDGTTSHIEGGRVGDSRQVIRNIKACKWNFIAYSTRDKISIKTSSIMAKYSLPSVILPSVMETYDALDHSQGMLRGKDMDAICCALIYVTLKKTKNCRSMHECANMVGVPIKKFTRILKFVDSKTPTDKSSAVISDKTAMINQYTSAIGFTVAQRKLVAQHLNTIESAPIAMYTKFAIAMYAVALQHDEDILEDIVTMLNVRKPTVVKNYEKYLKNM